MSGCEQGKPFDQLLLASTVQSQVLALTAGAVVITMEISPHYRHSFAGIEYYSDAAGTTPVVPTAGTETYLLQTTVKPSSWQVFIDSVINSADVTQVDWAANVINIKCTLASVTGAAYARLRVTGNIS